MRKLIIALFVILALVAAIGACWIFGGRELSLLVDRSISPATTSQPIKSIVYEGNGAGGILRCNGVALILNNTSPNPQPNVGTTANNELALSFGGRVFPFGPIPSSADLLACEKPTGDDAAIATWQSILSWPVGTNFITNKSPSWKRHAYQLLSWSKPNGAKLEILWRQEQEFRPGEGWVDPQAADHVGPGPIRVEISPASR